MGMVKMSSTPRSEISANVSTMISTVPMSNNAAAINPQADMKRETSFKALPQGHINRCPLYIRHFFSQSRR
jgi:hypothetical protein